MPLDRRKQSPLPDGAVHIVVSDNNKNSDEQQQQQWCGDNGDRRMLTLRDVEEAYQRRIQKQQQASAVQRRRKIHRNPSRSCRSSCCDYSIPRSTPGAVVVPLLLLLVLVVFLLLVVVLVLGESTHPQSSSPSWLPASLLMFPRNDHERIGAGPRLAEEERAMLQEAPPQKVGGAGGFVEQPQTNVHHHLSHSSGSTTSGVTTNSSSRSTMMAWLMSFPNSGTSYTLRWVREVSQMPTASNYADETPLGAQGRKRAVFPDQPTGPFWILNNDEDDTQGNHNQTYVLTKTHCGIRCNPCSPEEMAETTYSFRRRCFVTKWVNAPTGTNQYSTYPADRVRKAVHLFRDPFDNVVSRFHLVNQQTGQLYPADKLGFLQYCRSIDYQYTESETRYMHFAQNKLLSALWKVPCHADFLRYVEWHNLATVVQNDLQLDTFRLHYEDFGGAVDPIPAAALLKFLELPVRAAPTTPFVPDKSYRHYFSQSETKIIRDALHFAASRQTWEQIERYFEDDTDAVSQ